MARKSELTYKMIEPLIAFHEQDSRSIYVEFALPGSDEIFESRASIKKSKDVGTKVKRQVANIATRAGRMQASRLIRGAVGGGIIGRVASQSFNTASREYQPGQEFTEDEIEAAFIDAFRRVEKNFHYDEASGEWFKATDPPPPPPKSPFEELISAHPIVDPHDKNVFGRIMAELAYADGTVKPDEAALFKEIIPHDQPSLDVLAKADPVSKIEGEMVTTGVKSTIYMFAWVIALIDLHCDPVEEELLMEYADVFGLPETRREELIKMAKYFVLERNIDPDIPREDLFTYADKIRLTHDDAERCRIQYKRRVG